MKLNDIKGLTTCVIDSNTLKFCAKWTDDCQGKKDYDGDILYISTRYWPDFTAKSALSIKHGSNPDEYGFDNYVEILAKDFEGASQVEVQNKVEQWAQSIFLNIIELIGNNIEHIGETNAPK